MSTNPYQVYQKNKQNGCQSCIMSLYLNFTLESSKGGHSNKRYSRDITPNCHNCCNLYFILIHVICNYSCIYSYLLIKSTYMNAVIPANCIFIVFIVFILYLFLIYWKSYLFLFIVNQYMYSKLYKFSFEGKACYIKLFTNMY